MESVGFKEWAMVCEALGCGDQTVILRKGGIAEGRPGFSFKHREFFLFPTFFHEQIEKTRLGNSGLPAVRSNEIQIRLFAKVELTTLIMSWQTAEALEPFHVLQPVAVRERFDYDGRAGLHVAFVRVFRLEPAWVFPDAKAYAGCRSWVRLPEPPAAIRLMSILDEHENARRRDDFLAIAFCPSRTADQSVRS